MLFDLPIPAIIAHRGASASAPENTLTAFSLALKQNADAIEVDVKLTRDKHVIVLPSGKKGGLTRSLFCRIFAYNSVHFEQYDVTRSLVDKIHQIGKNILAYTVNEPKQVKKIFTMGIDGIFTDDPIMARNLILRNVNKISTR